MTDKKAGTTNPNDKRYVIRAKTPGYRDAMKRLYVSKLSRAQIHRILDITKGRIEGLKVAARGLGSNRVSTTIWFNFSGHRYDVRQDGTIIADIKLGPPVKANPVAVQQIKCQLCGTPNPRPRMDVKAKCGKCGFPLVKHKVMQRS